jgi:hypothetical protein
MKVVKMIVAVVLMFAGFSLAQRNLPAEGLVGHWTFDDPANLTKAAVGNALVPDTCNHGKFEYSSVVGPSAGDKAVLRKTGSFYRCFHDIEANGVNPAKPDSVPQRVNRWTIVIDFRIPSTGVWYGLHDSDNNGKAVAKDWDSFVRDSGPFGVGSTGYSTYALTDTKGWYRLVMVADLGSYYKYYLDGQLLHNCKNKAFDGRFSLDSPNGSNQILFFGDNDGEDAAMEIADLALYNRPLSDKEIYDMGGFGHVVTLGDPIGSWAFDKPDSLWFPTFGEKLEFKGKPKAVTGPDATNRAMEKGVGTHLIVTPNQVANGKGNPTLVNRYTFVTDIKVPTLGSYVALLQTDPANLSDADLFINPKGQIGSAALGWSDSTLVAGDWYRIAVSAGLGDSTENLAIYFDGKKVFGAAKLTLDGDLALTPRNGGNKVLFFADENGEDNIIQVASLALYNRTISAADILKLGGYPHEKPSKEVTPALKTVHLRAIDGAPSQYIKVPYHADFDFGTANSFTVEAWVKTDPGFAGDPTIISNKDWGSGGNPGWGIFVDTPDAPGQGWCWKFNAADDKRNRMDIEVKTPYIHDGNWHHVAAIVDQAKREVTLLTDDMSYAPRPMQTSGGVALGAIDNPGKFPICMGEDGTEHYSDGYRLPMQIDEVRIFKSALSVETVKAWMHKEVNKDHPAFGNLLLYLKFDEGQGNMIKDQSGKAHDAQLVNNSEWLVSYAPIGDVTAQAQTELVGIWAPYPKKTTGSTNLASTFAGAAQSVSAIPALLKDGDASTIQGTYKDEKYAVFGHNGKTGVTSTDLVDPAKARYERVWYFDKVDIFTQTVNLEFVMSAKAGVAANYVLLSRSGATGNFSIVPAPCVVINEKVMFNFLPSVDKTFITLGTKDQTASPLGLLTGVESGITAPYVYELKNAYPNPFNPSTCIEYSLAKASSVRLTIYNSLGQQVARIVDTANQPAGRYRVEWVAKNMTSGLYFYRLEAGEFVQLHKMLLLK